MQGVVQSDGATGCEGTGGSSSGRRVAFRDQLSGGNSPGAAGGDSGANSREPPATERKAGSAGSVGGAGKSEPAGIAAGATSLGGGRETSGVGTPLAGGAGSVGSTVVTSRRTPADISRAGGSMFKTFPEAGVGGRPELAPLRRRSNSAIRCSSLARRSSSESTRSARELGWLGGAGGAIPGGTIWGGAYGVAPATTGYSARGEAGATGLNAEGGCGG
jgi:hypothetical protein